MRFPSALQPLKKAATDFVAKDAPQVAAALSFYAVTAIPPLAVLVTAILTLVYSGSQASDHLVAQVSSLFGPSTGETIASILEHRSRAPNGTAAITGLAILLVGASGFFVQLQKALNGVWEVEPDPKAGWRDMIIKRVLSMTVVLGTGFLLLISLMLSAFLAATSHWLEERLGWNVSFAAFLEAAITLSMVTGLFALLFKYLPDVKIRWSDVWRGATTTSVLFVAGKFGLGWYLGRTDFTADYGSAGALVLILFWVYYSSMILLFGAHLTKTQAEARGLKPVAEEHARPKPGTQTVQRNPTPTSEGHDAERHHSETERR